ncbi:conserved hypothetical protein [delta proteobacterium NaphS2]|nr:conserved hypothetical protein [delta proteobacterium NaphS2]
MDAIFWQELRKAFSYNSQRAEKIIRKVGLGGSALQEIMRTMQIQ